MSARPLLVSTDTELIDDIVRLAAANAVEVHLATDAAQARSRWQVAPLVLVGGDAAMALAGSGLGRRREVVLVSRTPTAEDWKHAVVVGAEHVVSLPEGERWLIDRLADTGEGAPRNGPVVAVVGAGGGSGASTFAATLAAVATTRNLRVLLVDTDTRSGGLDVLIGVEDEPGPRWRDLAQSRGRLAAQALADSLPARGDLHVLAWGREPGPPPSPDVVAAVLDAASRGFDLVVVDVGRHLDATAELVLTRAEQVALVTAGRVRTAAGAALLATDLGALCARVGLVVRAVPRGVDIDAVADALGLPVLGSLPHARRLAAGSEEGRVPPTRDAYGRACARALDALVPAARR